LQPSVAGRLAHCCQALMLKGQHHSSSSQS
jgi:hypothetical protein